MPELRWEITYLLNLLRGLEEGIFTAITQSADHQSIIELEFSALYPGVWGLSGTVSWKFPRDVLKLAKVF